MPFSVIKYNEEIIDFCDFIVYTLKVLQRVINQWLECTQVFTFILFFLLLLFMNLFYFIFLFINLFYYHL